MTTRIRISPKLIRRKNVELQTGLSRSSIYQMIADGKFPSPIKIGLRSVGWLQDEVDDWVIDRIECSRLAEATL